MNYCYTGTFREVLPYNMILSENMMQLIFFSPTTDCPESQIDIVFLLDGSASVNPVDFKKMKTFVIEMIKSFIDRDTQV